MEYVKTFEGFLNEANYGPVPQELIDLCRAIDAEMQKAGDKAKEEWDKESAKYTKKTGAEKYYDIKSVDNANNLLDAAVDIIKKNKIKVSGQLKTELSI